MNVLNLYFTTTGNTEKVALRIRDTVEELGHGVDTVKLAGKDMEIDILKYDFVVVGSGVYGQLPGNALMDLFRKYIRKYAKSGEIRPAAPRRPSAHCVVYCTYGGGHTGINEAIPAVKYMGQLFDHLGYTILAEWYVIGEYKTERLREMSVSGRLGDIRGRPNEQDLKEIEERVKGLLRI
jgi:flavodoxin